MKTSFHRLLAILAVFCCSSALLPAAPGEGQPRMQAALELLHKAQGVDKPIPFLRAAKRELEDAHGEKGGFRVEAIKIVDRAITEAELGHPVKTEENIAAAITSVREGMAHAR